MLRLLTAAIASPLLLAALFLLPPGGWFAVLLIAVVLAAVELVRMVRPQLPNAPLTALPALVALFGLALFATRTVEPTITLLAAGLLTTFGTAALVLLGRTPLDEVLPAVALLAFGTPYLALPVVALTRLQEIDPWLVVLVLAVVWLGDTAAYYVGRRIGRHKMAPRVSPNKSWEGAAASLVTALVTAAVWCWIVLGGLDWRVLALGLVANTVGQIGDLFESLIKRGAGAKDSGTLLPGHGGLLDRIDALLLAAPVAWLGVLWIGAEVFSR